MRTLRHSLLPYVLLSGAAGLVAGALATLSWHLLRSSWRPSSTTDKAHSRSPVATAISLDAARSRSGGRWWVGISTALAVLVVVVAALGGVLVSKRAADARRAWAENLTGGSADRALTLIAANGCGGCHQIPGIPGADGDVGPPLAGIADRTYLGGAIANSPQNLSSWIRDARSVDSNTAMPTTGIPLQEARDIAAYLYSLR